MLEVTKKVTLQINKLNFELLLQKTNASFYFSLINLDFLSKTNSRLELHTQSTISKYLPMLHFIILMEMNLCRSEPQIRKIQN